MTNRKNTRRALVLSLLSLLLCCSMLVGTTFAWFTDAVTSNKNKIVAGNLDVELYYQNDETSGWTEVNKDTNVFKTGTLWEPGHTEVVKLKIVNAGTLALKYQLGVNVYEETESVSVLGNQLKLSDHIKFAVIDGEWNYSREQAVAAAEEKGATALNVAYATNDALLPLTETNTDNADVVTMVVYMPTTVGNEANYAKGAKIPTILLGLDLFATQKVEELDSFGPDYDKGAAWTGDVDLNWYFEDPDASEFVITNGDELAGLAALVNGTATAPVTTFAATAAPATVKDDFKGKTIKLGANIDLNDAAWTPIGNNPNPFLGNFDGQGYTVSNLKVTNSGWAGLIGHAGLGVGVTIKNVKINGATIYSNRMAGAVVGQIYGSIENCHVTDATITVVPNAVDGGYDNGDKVGGIVGWLGDNGDNRTIIGCSVTDSQISAYRDVGGIVGYIGSSTTVKGNSAAEIIVVVDQTTNNYGAKDPNAGEIVGRKANDNVTVENNNSENAAVEATYLKNGFVLRESNETSGPVLYQVPADYEAKTVEIPEGITAIGGYAFAYNPNVEKIVLPSTVITLNDRAFRDTSASTVVLNEGLTNISYQAFRNALNVKSVEIPSSVTTISKEAFQNSGITELVIPENVTKIEYGGLRDMKMLEKVTIKGNVDIPVYAFRACTNLRTVILEGDDVTIGGGSRGMIFTNTESGDGSAITIYVKNETVKARLLANDTAAKDYGGYKIEIITTEVGAADELAAALTSGGQIKLSNDVTLTEAVEISKDAVVDLNGHKIEGQEDVLVKISDGKVTLKNGTIKNVHAAATETKYGVYLSGDAVATIENVTIETTGTGIYAGGDAKIEKLSANVKSYMNANGYCCFDAVSLYDNARIEEITGGTYESQYAPAYIEEWYNTHSYSAIESWPINLNGDGAYIGEISGGTFLGVMDKANNGAAIHVNNGTIGEISGGYFGFSKTGLSNPIRLVYVNAGNNASIGKITGGKFEKGTLQAGFGCDFAAIVSNSGCQVKDTGTTVDVNIQFSTKVTTYTLNVLEVCP